MASVELRYGDNEWAKKLAQEIIDAQEEEMKDWLKTQHE